MRGWRWWGYITAEALTLIGFGIILLPETFENMDRSDHKGAYLGVLLIFGGLYRFYVGARNQRAKMD